MGILRPLHVHPSGCQNWFKGVTGSGSKFFGYCSTLAIYIYDLETMSLKRMIAGHSKPITGFGWSPHAAIGTYIVTTTKDGKCLLWDVETGNRVNSTRMNGIQVASCVEWSVRSEHEVALGSEDGTIAVWSTHPSTNRVTDVMDKPPKFNGTALTCLHVRWNPKRSGQLAGAYSDGTVVIVDTVAKTNVRVCVAGEDGQRGALADVQWDPHSSAYMLVAFKGGHVSLWDMEGKALLFAFDRVGPGVTALSWLPWAAGNFAVANGRSGVVRVLNVSQSAPLEHVRVGPCGVINFAAMPGSQRALCAFQDGSVGIYHLTQRQMEFQTKAGHTETVFDCSISAADPSLLATASYDGSVKIWDMDHMNLKTTLVGQEGILYCVVWSTDGQKLASCSNKGEVRIWDAASGRKLLSLECHSGKACFRVDWNNHPETGHMLASAGADHQCIVHDTVEGTLLHRLRHKDVVYGCAWSPHQPYILATACQDGFIRVFNLEKATSPDPFLTLKGHTAKVFTTLWHPLVPGVLASSSDDLTVRLWSIPSLHNDKSRGASPNSGGPAPRLDDVIAGVELERAAKEGADHACVGVLRGHRDNVRGLLWNHEVPYLLISGSWDSCIRVWDSRSGQCVQVVTEHLADVYGLACHPSRPFLLVSSSRDTSLRLWHLQPPQLASARIRALASLSLEHHCGAACEGVSNGAMAIKKAAQAWLQQHELVQMCGGASRRLHKRLQSAALLLNADRFDDGSCSVGLGLAGALEQLFEFFGAPMGTKYLFAHLRKGLQGARTDGRREETETTEDEESDVLPHESQVLEGARQEAADLEAASKLFAAKYSMLKREERLEAAAMLHLQAGRIKDYCELQVELGQWEKALALGPAVSLAYWKDLAGRRATSLQERLCESAVPFLVAAGSNEKAIQLYLQRREHKKAFLMAKVLEGQGVTGSLSPVARAEEKGASLTATERGAGAVPILAEEKRLVSGLQAPIGVGPRQAALDRRSSKLDPDGDGPTLAEQGGPQATSGSRQWLEVVSRVVAEQRYAAGEAVHAACCHLAVGDYPRAIQKLLMGWEVELAFAVGLCFYAQSTPGSASARARAASGLWGVEEEALVGALATHAELLGDPSLAVDVLLLHRRRKHRHDARGKRALGLVASRSDLSVPQVDALYEYIGLTDRVFVSGDEPEAKGGGGEEDGDEEEAIVSLLLQRKGSQAASRGLRLLRRWLGTQAAEGREAAERVCRLLWSVDAYHVPEKVRVELLACLSCMGALLAQQRGLGGVVSFLASNTRRLLRQDRALAEAFPVTDAQLLLLECEYCLPNGLDRCVEALEELIKLHASDTSSSHRSQCQAVLEALQARKARLKHRFGEAWSSVRGEDPEAACVPSMMGPDSPMPRVELRGVVCGPALSSPTPDSQQPPFVPYGAVPPQLRCVLTRCPIQGPALLLEDKSSYVAVADAHVLTMVYPFSPLNTGRRITFTSIV